MPLKDMSGQRFGRLVVVDRGGSDNGKAAKWNCVCDCGRTAKVQGYFLRNSLTVSCGCFNAERKVRHGMVGTREYGLWENAKQRATKQGIAFDLKPNEISIPERCPVLGIRMFKGNGKVSDNSATLDRLDPKGGYTTQNVRVISHRANSIKRNASVEELRSVIRYMEINGAGLAHERHYATA